MNASARYPPARPFAHSSQTSVATTSTSAFSKKAVLCVYPERVQEREVHQRLLRCRSWTPSVPSAQEPSIGPLFVHCTRPPSTLRKGSVTTESHLINDPQHQVQVNHGTTSYPNPRVTRTPKSQHSHSGSIYYNSENGSDLGHGNPYSASHLCSPCPERIWWTWVSKRDVSVSGV